MALFILILLLLAAMAGVLGAVLKATLVIVLSLVLTVVLLAWIGAWYAKRRMRAFQRDFQIRVDQSRRRSEAYDIGHQPPAGVLPPGSSETAGNTGALSIPPAPGAARTARDVLRTLEEMGDPSRLEGMARYGIRTDRRPRRHRHRAPTPRARPAARPRARGRPVGLGRPRGAHPRPRWSTTPRCVTEAQMDAWVSDLDSWDVCDAVCGNLFDRTPFALDKAVEWARREPEFEKRAAFAVMACAAVHRKDLPDAAFGSLLPAIREGATDDRNYVKKAVSWALRQIGKRSAELNARAIRDRRADRADRCPIRQVDRARRPPRAAQRRGAGAASEGPLT